MVIIVEARHVIDVLILYVEYSVNDTVRQVDYLYKVDTK